MSNDTVDSLHSQHWSVHTFRGHQGLLKKSSRFNPFHGVHACSRSLRTVLFLAYSRITLNSCQRSTTSPTPCITYMTSPHDSPIPFSQYFIHMHSFHRISSQEISSNSLSLLPGWTIEGQCGSQPNATAIPILPHRYTTPH